MKVNLRAKILKDGKTKSLYLDFSKDGKRIRESLKIITWKGDPDYKEKTSLAEKTRAKRLIELMNDEYDQISSNKKKASFINEFEKFVKTKPKWSNYGGALKHLKLFCPNDPIPFKRINKAWFNELSDYLSKQSGLSKNSSFIYFQKIKEVLYKAAQQGFLKEEIIRQARSPQRGKTERGYLELKELQKLMDTSCFDEDKKLIIRSDIKNAFLFSCFTGLRESDVRNLLWKNIVDGIIKIKQQKTDATVIIPISQTALNIIKSDGMIHLPDSKIFNLTNDRTKINRQLTRWFKKAEVNKKAFYHLSRHTFATLNLTFGNDIYTVSKLLGHKSLKTTEIYAKIIDEKKKQAMDNLPVLSIKKV